MKCIYCSREINNAGSLASHQKRCQENPDRSEWKPGPNSGGWNRGLSKKTDERLAKKSYDLQEKYAKGELEPSFKGKTHTKAAREKIRISINKRYDAGWMPKAGRCKKIKYKDFTVDGTWELAFCEWADLIGLQFDRNTERFPYQFEGKDRTYTPDFKLTDTLYVEVKGYETKLDRAKWRAFPHKLIILKKREIKLIQEGQFDLQQLYRMNNQQGVGTAC